MTVLQGVTREGHDWLAGMLKPPVPYLWSEAGIAALEDAVLRAPVVLCDPELHPRTGDELLELRGELRRRQPAIETEWIQVHWTEVIGRFQDAANFRVSGWSQAGEPAWWGSCEVRAERPGLVPTSGLRVIEAPKAGHPLLVPLLEWGPERPVRVTWEECDTALEHIEASLARTGTAVVHLVRPEIEAMWEPLKDALADVARDLPECYVTLDAIG